MRLESGRFAVGEHVVVSAHGKNYKRTVKEESGKPYVIVNGEKVFEDGISNNRPKRGTFDKYAYDRKYDKNHFDHMGVAAPKGTKDTWKQYAADLGMSMNAFIIYCVEKEING